MTARIRMTRREFVKGVLGSAAALAGMKALDISLPLLPLAQAGATDAPPEVTAVRIARIRSICIAPEFVAELFLPSEGFTDVQYVTLPTALSARQALAAGQIDFGMRFVGSHIVDIDEGDPIVILGGVHVGCFELFTTERIQTIRDLKGKTVSVTELGSGRHLFLVSLLQYVGLDPRSDVNFVTFSPAESMRLLVEGKIDGFQAFPPEPQEMRARKIGRVLVNTMMDRPWSQYFCCEAVTNREFVRRHPVATKRVLRAILRATDLCAREPGRVAKFLVAKGYTPRYDYALQTLREVGYANWRDYDPEDTVRFYALRLHEAGMIKSSPRKIIAEGTNWRFLNEIKRELKQ